MDCVGCVACCVLVRVVDDGVVGRVQAQKKP